MRAKLAADLQPRPPRSFIGGNGPSWPKPAPYRYIKFDKSRDTSFTARLRQRPNPRMMGIISDATFWLHPVVTQPCFPLIFTNDSYRGALWAPRYCVRRSQDRKSSRITEVPI
jgi:hypothetical protein